MTPTLPPYARLREPFAEWVPGRQRPASSHGFAGIRRGILVLAAAILVITTVGVTVGTLQERTDRILEAKWDATSLSRALEDYVARVLSRTALNLADVRGTLEARGGPERTPSAQLEELVRRDPVDNSARRHILVAGPDGMTHAFGGGGPSTVPSIAHREFFRQHIHDTARKPRVSAPFRTARDGRWRLPISARIDHPDGSFGGIVMTTLDVEALAEYFGTIGVPHGGAVALITPNGEFLARHPVAVRDPNAAVAEAIGRMLQGMEGHLESPSPVDERRRVGAYRKLGDYPVYLVVTFAYDELLAKWRRNAALRTLGGAGVLAVTAIFTLLLLRRLRGEHVASANLARFRRAVDLSGDLIYWVDSAGRITYMNDAAGRRARMDPRRLPASMHIRDISANYTPERWDALSENLERDGELTYASEHTAADGSRYPVQVSATHVESEGNSFGFLICRDLSAQRQQEDEIRHLNASLEGRVAERTAELAAANGELESFAYSVSHDLRAPLNHITAYAEELAEVACGDPRECRRLTAKVIERAQYMNELIEGILALSRIGRAPLDRAEVNVSSIARQIDEGHRRLERDRKVETVIQEGLVASGDPVLIRTLLENLLGNAWKYTSKKEEARIELFAEDFEGTHAFVVRDNGAGFDPRYAARLFGTFHRLHSQAEFPGSGIGLATARRIVSRHGGRIWADGSPGAGATFRFTIRGQTT